MPQYGTWVSYGGAARIWLAVVLLAAAGGLVCAGIWLPLPARAATPGRAAVIATLVAWVASIAAWLACVIIYVRQDLHAYHLPIAKAAPPDHVAPFTFVAVVAVFVIILTRGSPGGGTRLASAAIGAIAALAIFELPFDLIVMARLYPPVPPDPALYRALFFVPLFLIEIITLLLLAQSPMVRLTRATFFSLALMLGVFAVWALSGFGYPSAPVPLTLNIVSKFLAFAVVLTLFFPRRSPVIASTPPHENEQTEPANRPLAAEPGNTSAPDGQN
jgi:hypothetical protein